MKKDKTHTVRDSHRADHYSQLADIARLEQEKAALELENALLKSQVKRLQNGE